MPKPAQQHYLYVFQVGDDPKNVYVGHSPKSPEIVLERFNSNAEIVPKKIRKKTLKLRPDLYELYPTQPTQEKALFYERIIAQKLNMHGYNILSKSLHKKVKNSRRILKAYSSAVSTLSKRRIDYRDEANSKINKGDSLPYGRKKTLEWNDEASHKLENALAEKAKKRLQDKE